MDKPLGIFGIVALALTVSCGSNDADKGNDEPRVTFTELAPEYAGRWFLEVTDQLGSVVHRVDLPDVATTVTLDPFGDVLLDDLGECGVRIHLDDRELPEQGCVVNARESIQIEGTWGLDGDDLRVELTGTSTISTGSGDPIIYRLRGAFDGAAASPPPSVYCSEVDGQVDTSVWTLDVEWSDCDDRNDYAAYCWVDSGEYEDSVWACQCDVNGSATGGFRVSSSPVINTDYVSSECGWDITAPNE